jgi:cytochrome c-type biogenesis protein CcmH
MTALFKCARMFAVIALLVLPAATEAQEVDSAARDTTQTTPADSILEARTTAVAQTLRCPVCKGESIQDSPAELAQQMRGVVRDQLRAGKTPEEVRSYFAARYGEWILLEPRMTGLNVLLYAFPVVLVLGGLAFVAFLVRRWTSRDPDSPTPSAPA